MASSPQLAECVLTLPTGWVDTRRFEDALWRCGDALGTSISTIIIRFPAGCKLMIDVAIRLLSFCNQLAASTRRLRLEFSGGGQDVMGYLDRMGFFDHLAASAEVVPGRPVHSAASLYRGSNGGLVEIERFNAAAVDDKLVLRLASTVERSCATRGDVKQIKSAIFSIFGELIGNVIEHSGAGMDAFAVLQTYPAGNRVRVAVSDSGIGIIQSLRPVLRAKGDPLGSSAKSTSWWKCSERAYRDWMMTSEGWAS